MRAFVLAAVSLCVLLGAAVLASGQSGGRTETPEALYEQCQALQVELDGLDAEVRDLSYRVERQEKALANYEYVKAHNSALIESLEAWVEPRTETSQ